MYFGHKILPVEGGSTVSLLEWEPEMGWRTGIRMDARNRGLGDCGGSEVAHNDKKHSQNF